MSSGTEHLRKAEIILAEAEAQVKPGAYSADSILRFAELHALIAIGRKLDQLANVKDEIPEDFEE